MSIIKVICMASLIQIRMEKSEFKFYLFMILMHKEFVLTKKNIIGNLRNINKNNLLGLINLGQKGNGPLTRTSSLIEYSSVTSPKKIFWLYYEGNDLKKFKIRISK